MISPFIMAARQMQISESPPTETPAVRPRAAPEITLF